MNQRCYRLVFNRARGLLMAVAETTPSQSAAGSSPRLFAGTALAGLLSLPLSQARPLSPPLPLSLPLLLLLPLLPINTHAQIVPDAAAPAHHQAIVSAAANGVPLVHIQTPTAGGVLRNAFTQFDVQSNGVILNNANQSVQTSLGGWVQANPMLDRPASVIVNEVNSSHPSLLHGYTEVAGQRAQVIIANPSGISCDGCGFINASRATLTTGVPHYSASGNLDHYLVRRGMVSFAGDGLDSRSTDYTDVLARAVQVNAALHARQLNVIAGSNEVRAGDLQTTAMASGDDKPTFAIDVSELGGMYAGKIWLVGTEAGVGTIRFGRASVTCALAGYFGRFEGSKMNPCLKVLSCFAVTATLSACCPNGCFVLSGAAFEALAYPTPLREQWLSLDRSDAERRLDWEGCGGYKDGGFSPKEELIEKEKRSHEKDILPAHHRLYLELQRCMKRLGYQYIGKCYDNEISRSLPACGGP